MKYQYGNLGQLIVDCVGHGINMTSCDKLPAYFTSPIKAGNFVFSASSHSTGIGVKVLLVHPETKETHIIINGTYWGSESTYGFNKFTWNHGAWDEAFSLAVEELKGLLAVRVADHTKKQEAAEEAEKNKAQTEKEKFEAIYKEAKQ